MAEVQTLNIYQKLAKIRALSDVVKKETPALTGKAGVGYEWVWSFYLIKSTERFRKAARAAPFSIPFWSRARSVSWWMMSLPLAASAII